MRAYTRTASVQWFTQWCGPGFAMLVCLLLGACVAGTPAVDVPDVATTPSPIVLQSSTDEVTGEPQGEIWLPMEGVPLRDASSTPTVVRAPERGAEAVVQPDVAVALRLGDQVKVAGTGWTVGFREVVEDSRCPADVQCVWAGQVSVRLLGEHTDGRVAALTLTMPAGGPSSGALGDLQVEARRVEPARRAGFPPPESYVLDLRFSAPSSSSTLSGVRGRVTIGPMCPVMRVDQPCPDQPYRAVLIVRDSAGSEIARIEPAVDGAYALPLSPGSYLMAPLSPPVSRLPWAPARAFDVQPSVWTVLDVAFDSGIR